ncbi:MAG TPA: ferrochelatase [Candidatus Dormibacteraeota bacterium]|nr:ferrochelatase [Candidatus Dormibacteraeota bacterium]
MSRDGAGVLCMAYGSPRTEADVEAYFTHIRGGRPPSAEALEELKGRYRAIGGSPLEGITRRQAAALGDRLKLPVFAGMRHSRPFIADAAAEARAAGVHRLIGLPLAPHFARMSVGAYEAALAHAWSGPYEFIGGFHDNPAFIQALCGVLDEATIGWRPDRVFFTAHSLPARIVAEGDRYDLRLLETCELVAARMTRLPQWEFAFQSASHTGEPWLGPDLLEALERSDARRVLVCPIGFVADHLEVLYDIDVEAQSWARARGVELRRTGSFNDRPEFIEALVEIVRPRLGGGV